MKNKTLATWLTFVGGPLGLHRFYLFGMGDVKGWLLPIPTALGFYGIERARDYGLDDTLSWLLIPLLGFTVAACALNAIVYGLMSAEKWNAAMNPQAANDAPSGLSLASLPPEPLVRAAIASAPPMVPGMPNRNSRPPILAAAALQWR